jgi:hypothetical protein
MRSSLIGVSGEVVMKKGLAGAPSAAMVVAVLALVVAASGTAIAASQLVVGDKLIKKQSLSGNRLRNHTIVGTQVNLNRLGKVPSAASADHATNAANAANATSATNANHATSADSATNATSAISASAPTTLASGHTVTGFFALRGVADSSIQVDSTQAEGISYGWRLSAVPTPHVILLGQATPAGCSGNESNPGASPGSLCVFEGFSFNRGSLSVCPVSGCQTQDGAMLIATSAAAGLWDSAGSWAATAP